MRGPLPRLTKKTMSRGEFELIEWIRKQQQHFPEELLKGIGDDCALFDPSLMDCMAVASDVLVEGVHFQMGRTSPGFLGWKSLAVNLSDLAAVGAEPFMCLLNLVLPAQLTSSFFEAFLAGFLECGRRWKCPLVGGDLSGGSLLCASVTVLGSCGGGPPLLRSGARVGDLILVAGALGLSRTGLEILQEEAPAGITSAETEDELRTISGDEFRFLCLKAHLKPQPQVELGTLLRRQGLASAVIDVSDGLGADLGHLVRESRVRAELAMEGLELLTRVSGERIRTEAVLEGGEDYALLLSAAPEQVAKLKAARRPDWPPLTEVGRIVAGDPGIIIKEQGGTKAYEPRGFDHFR